MENVRLQYEARMLAGQLTAWLAAPISETTPVDGADPDLVEWCRKARDILEAVRDA